MDGQYGGRVRGYARPEYVSDPFYPTPRAPRFRRRGRRRRAMPLWQELPLLLIIAFCLAVLIRTFLLQAFFIPSASMETTLLIGDRVLVNKIVYDIRDPRRGEIVVFRGTEQWAPENRVARDSGFLARIGRTMGDLVGIAQPGEKDFIKRVIGLPGDKVSCCDPATGAVVVNGQPLDEHEYLPDARNSPLERAQTPGECGPRTFAPVVVPPGQIFVMGDNRIVSQDSRCQGTVPIENIIGRAFVIVWPNKRWHGLSVPPEFNDVPRRPSAAPAAPSGPPASPARGAIDVVLLLPLLASLATAARSRQRRLPRRRKLLE
jgi:signal peptidase I